MPTINDRIGSQNIIRVLANASAPPTRVNNLVDVNSTRKDETGATGYLLIWDRVTQKYNLGNDIAAGINVQGISTFSSHVDFGEVNFSGVTTAPTLVATEAIAMGATTVITAARQLQNIASLDATTTATIESAITNAPNTFTDLQITGLSTFIGASRFNSVSTFNLGLNVATGVATFTPAVDMDGGLDVSGGVGLNVVGHTELDNLNVSGVSTFVGVSTFSGDVYIGGDLYLKDDLVLDNITGNSLKITGISTFDGLVDINAGGQANTFKVEDLTSGRVVLAGTGGEIEDSANLTFNGTTLALTGAQTISSNLTVSGNVSIAGTLTYEDVTNVDSVGIVTAGKGVRVTTGGIVVTAGVSTFTSAIDANGSVNISGGSTLDRLFLSGITTFKEDVEFHGNGGTNALYWDKSADSLKLVDDVKIQIGTGLDMQLYHNGDYSYLDNNTGNLYIRNNVDDDDGGNIYVQAKSGEDSLIANDDGSVEVFYDGARRIETLGAGTTFTDDVFTNRFFEGYGAIISGVVTATGGIDGGSY